ncbi:MAG TPA: glycosyltransferase [Candidatus Babeliales bacterium]|jgi:mannosyltransferase OCH1-like enzyme|nr:glycosyltransferase [Candidatus Babeliales bacterium]
MKIQKIIAFLYFLYSYVLISQTQLINNACTYIPFDVAMQKIYYLPEIGNTERIVTIDGITLYNFFKNLYDLHNPAIIPQKNVPVIPKIIHQIWLGSPVPSIYQHCMQSWIDHHPDWHYKLWTDENVHEITLYNKKFYDEAQNYGTKSDILRWEILYQYGGLYVDVDYECFRSFDLLHHIYDFYTGIQPLDTQMVQLGAALVGSRPGHPILEHCIMTIKDHWHLKGAPKKTGPVHFTQSFYAQAGKNGSIDIALPPFYVYPLGCREKVQNNSRERWIKQGSFAIHWWSKSWMPKEYRPALFRTIDNAKSAATWND